MYKLNQIETCGYVITTDPQGKALCNFNFNPPKYNEDFSAYSENKLKKMIWLILDSANDVSAKRVYFQVKISTWEPTILFLVKKVKSGII